MKDIPLLPGYTYHFLNNGNNEGFLFFEPRNYDYFLDLMQKYLVPVCDIYAYALLPKHFHLLLKIKKLGSLPEKYVKKPYLPFSHFFNAYAKAINKAENRKGSLFSTHPHKVLIDNTQLFLDALAYIHFNPQKHQIVKSYIDYEYTSFHAYLSVKDVFIEKTRLKSILNDENYLIFHEKRKRKILG